VLQGAIGKAKGNGVAANGSLDAQQGMALASSGAQLSQLQHAVVEAAKGLKVAAFTGNLSATFELLDEVTGEDFCCVIGNVFKEQVLVQKEAHTPILPSNLRTLNCTILQETLSSKLDAAKIVQELYAAMRGAAALWEGDEKAALVTLTQVLGDQEAHMARLAKDARVVMESLK
jgi:hypothetical protein